MALLDQSKGAKAILLDLKDPIRIIEGFRLPAEGYGGRYWYLQS
jgi:hypothetical protein